MKFLNTLPRSGFILLAANLLPLCGVIFWEWQVFDVMIAYWLENVIIGLINILKMLTCAVKHRRFEAVLIIPFFTFHYGMFTAVHGLLVFAMFGNKATEAADFNPWSLLEQTLLLDGMGWVTLSLFLSHMASFFMNFMGKGEIDRTSPHQLMHAPYKRVVILHLTILLGGFLALALDIGMGALILLTILKIITDLFAHKKSHTT